MIKDKKIIGICLSRLEDDFRNNFLDSFFRTADENNFKIIVFNSMRDLYDGDLNDKGSLSVFDAINYDALDALVILYESIFDKSVIHELTQKAKDHSVPAVIVHGECDGCYNIRKVTAEAYKEVLRHIIMTHKRTRPVFIAGYKGDADSEERIGCFKEILAESGTEYSDDMLYYGDYWDVPTRIAVQTILSSGKELPDAFICANDTMAMSVCEELELHGYKVPQDTIVSGFDGLLSAEYFIPRLTTCREELSDLARIVTDIINGATAGTLEPGSFYENYFPYIGESCGCGDDSDIDYRERARQLYHQTQEMQRHEIHIYSWVDTILESDNINSLSTALHDYILPNSSVCLRENFIMAALGKSPESIKEKVYNELIVITSMEVDHTNGKQGRFPVTDMVPELDKWLDDKTVCILTPIYEGSEVCGYYALKTEDIADSARKLFRVSKTMNISFGSLLNRISKKNMQNSMKNARYIDSLTGLPNLVGLSKWFDDFSSSEKNHSRTLMVSLYFIPQYKYIYENYGIEDIEEAVKFVGDSLLLANKDNGYVARTATDEFVVINDVDDESKVSFVIDNAVSVFFGIIEGYNKSSDKDYFLEVNCGCTVANPGWNSTLRSFLKLASAEMYVNRLKAGLSPILKDDKIANPQKDRRDLYGEFSTLVEKNLFTYHFQPIVNAKTGEIYAYEALMRSSGGIKMSPLEILDIAKEYNMLYEVEKATMFNVMERYAKDTDMFGGAKVFINTIPGNFLNDDDINELKERYRKYLSNFVFEITEQDTVSDEELNSIRRLGAEDLSDSKSHESQVAVDDYGTGHSNIVNLLRYAPHIIKIDRFLITNIQNDPNKQMFVKSTIEFSKLNNIKVLAEGVETFEEMQTVIEYGVDLIQGFYAARPAPDPIRAIPESIRREIIEANITASRYDNELLAYNAADGEIINLYSVALEKYGRIHIKGGRVTLEGTKDMTVAIPITTEEGSNCVIRFENVCIKPVEGPALSLGKNSSAELKLEGSSKLINEGILVPDNSSLRITGSGDLDIQLKRNRAIGIGNNYEGMYGNISFEHTGKVSIVSTIDKSVGIGGGVPSEKNCINFISGTVDVFVQCVNSICIGSVRDKATINVGDLAYVKVKSSGKESVGIGSFDGKLTLSSSGILDVVSDGERTAALGTISKAPVKLTFTGGKTNAVTHGDDAVCIGSIKGSSNIECMGGFVRAYGEGNRVTGFGSTEGEGLINITGGTVNVKILSGNINQFGGENSKVVITGGNIIADNPTALTVTNAFGQPLHPEIIDGDSFIGYISTESGDYKYTAEKRSDDEKLVVYIP